MAPLITAAGFRHWRRTRPFWGGLLLLLAGIEMFLSANQSLGDLEVHFGPQGFLSYLLPALLLLCGILTWVSPGQRLFYGVIGLLTAVYSLVGLNFGGFVLGLLLGITGGALVLAWAPPRPAAAPPPPARTADDTVPLTPATEAAPAAALPYGPPPDPDTGIVPGFRDDDTESFPSTPPAGDEPRGGTARKALVITLVPLVVGGLIVAGGRVPARAADCPEGLPSRSSAASPTTTKPSSPAAKPSKTPAAKPSPSAKPPSSPTPPPTAKPSATPSASSTGDSDPIGDIIGGIGDLLDPILPDPPSPTPSASPSTS
uniref:DUF6114 domain-containing protein n=1 Tax=Actinoplanes sp. RD1 TaxID=3064538 RepID=UPI0027414AEC